MAAITRERLEALLQRARETAAAAQLERTETAIAGIQHQHDSGQLEVDVSGLGLSGAEHLLDEEADVLMDCIAASCEQPHYDAPKVDTTTAVIEQHTEHEHEHRVLGVARDDLTYNSLQQQVVDEVEAGRNVVCIGKAGTGKTTCMRGSMQRLLATGKVGKMSMSTKWLHSGGPGVAVVSYTRKAVNNIRHAMPDEIKPHTITLHKLLEFKPVYYEVLDEETGKERKTMRFEPSRNANNPLPDSLRCVAFEEGSMIGVDLHKQWLDAMPHEHQAIYLGDIQQLPPVFGAAILGFKMMELKVVELQEVYRQALESPILAFALSLLDGDARKYDSKVEKFKAYHPVFKKEVDRIRVPSLDKFARGDELVIQVWQKKLSPDTALHTTIQQFNMWSDSKYYDHDEDIILLPFNKAFGTVELNKGIAQHLGRKREATVHEVIAGYNKHYLAIGDRVLYDKEDAFIIDIVHNDEYIGKRPQLASKLLDRWGHKRDDDADADAILKQEATSQEEEAEGFDLEAIEKFMTSAAKDVEDRVTAASHVITLRVPTGDQDVELNKAAEINLLLGGYAITVHKSQGSEWDKVFFIMHQSHAVMNQRELLYTACTRAAKRLHIICEPDTFERGVRSQAIKGNTLAEKAEYFKGRYEQTKEKLVGTVVEGAVAGASTGSRNAPPPVIAPTDKPPVKLTRLCDHVSNSFKAAANASLNKIWEKAMVIWGGKFGDAIGNVPTLDYNLQSSKTIGMARYGSNVIALNPLWCILADEDAAVHHEMTVEVMIHEVCHFVAKRYSREFGHNAGWIMAMKLMGAAPNQYYTGDVLTNWGAKYVTALAAIKARLDAAGAETADDYTQIEQGEEA